MIIIMTIVIVITTSIAILLLLLLLSPVSACRRLGVQVHTADDRSPAPPYIPICTILPEFLYFWYMRSIYGHARFLS